MAFSQEDGDAVVGKDIVHEVEEGDVGFRFRPMQFPGTGSNIDFHDHSRQPDSPGDYHHCGHVTFVVRGPILMRVKGKEGQILNEGESVYIAKDVLHAFTALAPHCLAYCIFAMRKRGTMKATHEFSGDHEAYA